MSEPRALFRGAGNARNVQRNLLGKARAEALAHLRRLAVGINEPTEAEAVERLLERVASAEPEARAALLELGARAILSDQMLEAAGMGRTRRSR